jgi:predicted DCC family thiol-disulfide oxidoreductase YuxK
LWSRALRLRGFGIARLQDAWVRERLGLGDAELLRDIRLLLEDGSQVVGATAYRYVMRRIGWAYPLFVASNLPLARQTFDWAYRAFARNRFRFSRACGLANGPQSKSSAGHSSNEHVTILSARTRRARIDVPVGLA